MPDNNIYPLLNPMNNTKNSVNKKTSPDFFFGEAQYKTA